MSLIAAAQITAVATAVLALFAIVTAVFAFLAFRKQSREVGLLQEQATREAAERRRAQAAKVFAAIGGQRPDMAGLIRVINSSGQPIYDVVVSWSGGAELPNEPRLLPGEEHRFSVAVPEDAVIPPVVWLDFRDAAGLRWRTTSQGQLTGPQGLEPPARPHWWQIRRHWAAKRARRAARRNASPPELAA
jgi:hypothetical protein